MIKDFLKYISNLHLGDHLDEIRRKNAKRINLFAFLIGILFIVDSIRDLIFGYIINSLVLFLLGCFYLLLFFFTKARYNSLFNLFSFELIIFVIFFFSSTAGFDNGLSLYYFIILVTSLFVFNEPTIVKYNIIVYVTVLILFFISHCFDFKIFSIATSNPKIQYKSQRLFAFLQAFIGISICGYFVLSKHFKVLRLYQQSLRSDDIIADLRQKLEDKDKYVIEEVVKLAMNDDVAFIPKFKQVYYHFYANLKEINPEMTTDEFKFCALLKLGFTTKDIAEYNHLAIRTVQTKKNRLRKSFNISSEYDLYDWVDHF